MTVQLTDARLVELPAEQTEPLDSWDVKQQLDEVERPMVVEEWMEDTLLMLHMKHWLHYTEDRH